MVDSISLAVAIIAVVIALFSWQESREHSRHFRSIARSLESMAAARQRERGIGESTVTESGSPQLAYPAIEEPRVYERPKIKPWVDGVSWGLLVTFIAYAVYFGLYVFPTDLILTDPVLEWIFFGLMAANFGWQGLLTIAYAGIDSEERRYILTQLETLRRTDERDKPPRG